MQQRGVVSAARRLGSRQVASFRDGTALALLIKVLLVCVLRRLQPKAVNSFELLSLAVPLPDVLARWLVRIP